MLSTQLTNYATHSLIMGGHTLDASSSWVMRGLQSLVLIAIDV